MAPLLLEGCLLDYVMLLATFHRCMMSMFSDLVEEAMQIFMDDFSVYGSCFENCLKNLETVLQRCQDKKSSFKLGKMSFYGNRRYCLGTQDLCCWIGSRPRKSCCYKKSHGTYNNQGDKKLPWTCWFLQKERIMSRQGNVCRDTGRRSFCRDKEMYVVTLKEEETQVVIDKRGRNRRCVISELTWSQQKNSMLLHTAD